MFIETELLWLRVPRFASKKNTISFSKVTISSILFIDRIVLALLGIAR